MWLGKESQMVKQMAQLQDLFQTHAMVKILDHLTLFKDFEYTKTDIANETGMSRRTLYQVWPLIERFNLVELTKTSGKIKFFKFNEKNPIGKQLIALADEISFFEVDKIPGIKTEIDAETMMVNAIQKSDSDTPIEVTISEKEQIVYRTFTIKGGTTAQVEEWTNLLNNKKNAVKVQHITK